MAGPEPIRHQRAHDYRHLIRRWRRALRGSELGLHTLCEAGGYPIHYLETRRPAPGRPWLYLSAGIHGDEPATTEALLRWFEERPTALDFNALIFPCLNPWGIVNNSRFDADGRDLNRSYHDHSIPQTAAHKAVLHGRRFALAISLHEDYDANGYYIYEVRSRRPFLGERLLAAAARHVPIDNRKSIEGRSSRAGLIRRQIQLYRMPLHPEAFVLHFEHSDRTFTIESPSETHIDQRVAAHVAVINAAVAQCFASPPCD